MIRNKFGQFTKENIRSNSARWRGGKTIDRYGYLKTLDKGNPMADCYGYVYDHRLVMSNHIGRILTKNDVVHHINHIKTDNRIENLELLTQREHKSIHGHEAKKNLTHPSGKDWYRIHKK